MPKVYNKYHRDAPEDAVYIGRPSRWGNPFKIGVHAEDRDQAVDMFEDWILSDFNEQLRIDVRRYLRDKNLICFCAPKRCHGDVLLRVANE